MTSVAQTTSGVIPQTSEDGTSPAVQVTLLPAATSENLFPPLSVSPGSEEIEGAWFVTLGLISCIFV